MKHYVKWLIGFIGVLVILAIAGIAFIYSGLYNVAATYPDGPLMAWVMSATADHSIQRRAAGIKVEVSDDPATLQLGLSHYREMCAECHGAPGVEVGASGRGLNPDPPKLSDEPSDLKPNELFWIIKNGIRMTGMPAWGKTHSDKEIWAIVSFVQKLPKMSKEEYQKLSEQAPQVD